MKYRRDLAATNANAARREAQSYAPCTLIGQDVDGVDVYITGVRAAGDHHYVATARRNGSMLPVSFQVEIDRPDDTKPAERDSDDDFANRFYSATVDAGTWPTGPQDAKGYFTEPPSWVYQDLFMKGALYQWLVHQPGMGPVDATKRLNSIYRLYRGML